MKTKNEVKREEVEFNYDYQCWIVNGVIKRCGHPETMNCKCFGKTHAGKSLAQVIAGGN